MKQKKNLIRSPDSTNQAWTRLERLTLEIVRHWDKTVRQELPAAKKQNPTILYDALPDFLSNLARDLTLPQRKNHLIGSLRLARHHGRERASIDEYSLNQVLLEYHLLRKCIMKVLLSEGTLSNHEQEIINDSIDRGIAEAGEAFMQMRLSKEREHLEQLRHEREMREQFIITLTHDLRNPLTAAKLNAQTIVRNPETLAVNKKLCVKLLGNVDRIDRMIQDLLDSNRVNAGEKIVLQVSPCDLKKVAEDVLELASNFYEDRFLLRSPETVQGYWDCDALRRAIENLIQNAVKYGSKDTPITLNLIRDQADVRISVHNYGNPIPKDYESLLFKPFWRIESSQREQAKGWGIGLTAVRGVVEAHGGKVHVQSDPQKGTTFTLTIPQDARSR